jgi:gluconate 2-dehydrogenase gamma chain
MWGYKAPKERFLTDEEKQQVVAIFEAILPGGDKNPGATDVRAADYLDRLLAMDDSEYYEIADWKPLYRAGLAMLNAASQGKFKKALYQLNADQMTALLTDLKAGNLDGFPSPAWQRDRFFPILRQHCIEGSFADPRWGGNRDGLMWSWYGYPNGPSKDFTRTPKRT